jgi:HSP20 family molecular chaperone IbpA
VDADKAHAEFDNGVLHLTIPKVEAAKPKTITIQAK